LARSLFTSGATKRLTPKADVLRELYLKSGNLCAFPGCRSVMLSAKGDFIGQVCHIYVSHRSRRVQWAPLQSKANRRRAACFGNLMLMCYPHHKETDDVGTYAVARLQEMKATHEAKFTNVIRKMQMSVKDQTERGRILPQRRCRELVRSLGGTFPKANWKKQ